METAPHEGLLLVDKPPGMTSHDVVSAIRRHFRIAKVGHCGTLDPCATGLLLIVTGRATRLSQALTGDDKEYAATIRLGIATSTHDTEGEILATRPVPPLTEPELRQAMARFTGDVYQTPPMASAIKIDGQKLYKLARRGQEIERPARLIHLYRFELLGFTPPDLIHTHLRCSKGTYVRTLAHDLGAQLGCGAHLAALRRTGSGPFRIEQAHALHDLLQLPPEPQAVAPLVVPYLALLDAVRRPA